MKLKDSSKFMRNERGDIIMDATEIKKCVRHFYE
jgi:hypothetical protein